MSNEKFTKGPWLADIRGGCCAVYEKTKEGDTPGCHWDDERNIYYSSNGANYNGRHWSMSDEAIANAHLISQAPAMYEMLERVLDAACEPYACSEDFADEVLLLLAKARGES